MDPIVDNTAKQVQTVPTINGNKYMSVCGRWKSLFQIPKGGDMNSNMIAEKRKEHLKNANPTNLKREYTNLPTKSKNIKLISHTNNQNI